MMGVSVAVHRPEPARLDVLDSGTTWLQVGDDFGPDVTIFFDGPAETRDWLLAALAEVDTKLGLVRITP